ncbi:MAG: restriction endonuclease subunit [Sphingobacteriales bacterium]|nr:restriction endonuclease subunit [Sphingobacteriales bacterium]
MLISLNKILNEGRLAFLQALPKRFSRVLHDYSDERKGFGIWKDIFEERIT